MPKELSSDWLVMDKFACPNADNCTTASPVDKYLLRKSASYTDIVKIMVLRSGNILTNEI